MKNYLLWVAAVTLLIASSVAVGAQDQADKGGAAAPQVPKDNRLSYIVRPMTPVMTLLRNADIQQELKLQPEQIEKIKARWDEQNRQFRSPGFHSQVRKTMPQLPTQQMVKERLEQLTNEERAWVTTLLDRDQKRRFDQLVLQYVGPPAINIKIAGEIVGRYLIYPEVAEQLKITAEQWAMFKKIDSDTFQRYHNFVARTDYEHLPPKKAKEFMAKLDEINWSGPERKLALLTDEQRATWKTLLGAPFNFPPELQNHWNTPKP